MFKHDYYGAYGQSNKIFEIIFTVPHLMKGDLQQHIYDNQLITTTTPQLSWFSLISTKG